MMGQRMMWGITGRERRYMFGATVLAAVVLCVMSIRTLPAAPGADRPVHIHMIGASSEYNAKDTLMLLNKRLTELYDVKVTMTRGPGEARELDGLEQLESADLLVLYTRRLKLNDEDWSRIQAYLESDRPIVAIRTASHAFDKNFPDFDEKILGASYQGHRGDKPVQVSVVEKHRTHPILEDISSWKRAWGDLYDNVNFADSTTVLLNGDDGRRTMPVAWTNQIGDRRVFYTSMGIPEDFRKDEQFMRLLVNGIKWSLEGALSSVDSSGDESVRPEDQG